MKNIIYILFLLPIVVFSQLKAFPTAEGYAKFITGGRGGTIIHVTNLNDNGTGSLREALENTQGTRTIVFDVGGTIQLAGDNSIDIGRSDTTTNLYENVTVAGETAPSPGITIQGGGLEIQTSNVIIRNITIRCDVTTAETNDAIRLRNWGAGGYIMQDIMMSNLSISHGSDENLNLDGFSNAVPLRRVTFQNSILGSNFQQQKNILRGLYVEEFSLLENYLSHCWDRNPLVGYGTQSTNDSMEEINNIIYGGGIGISYESNIDLISNIYRQPPDHPFQFNVISYGSQGYGGTATSTIHLDGNFAFGPLQAGANYYSGEAITFNNVNRQLTNSEVNTWLTNQTDIENKIFSEVGPLYRDDLDNLWINNYLNDTGGDAFIQYTIVPKSLVTRPGSDDSDNDDMLDVAEIAVFGSIGVTNLPNSDTTSPNYVGLSGYTNIEKTHFYLAGDLILAGVGTSEGVTTETGRKTGDAVLISN